MHYVKMIQKFLACRRVAYDSREKLDAVREKRLRAILGYAYTRSPYYRQAFSEHGLSAHTIASAPLTAFPTTDKETLMQHFDDVVTVPGVTHNALLAFDEREGNTAALFKGKYQVVHSSGSTGKPGYFLYDEASWNQTLLGIVRGALWNMSDAAVLRLLIRRPRVLYVAATDGRYGGVMAVSGGVGQLRMKQLSLDINTPLAQWVTTVRDFDPGVIIGYPSAIKLLAELVSTDALPIHAERIISCGEPLTSGARTFFERTFGVPVVNFYGASESLALGVEVDPAEGMVLFDDLNWVEVCQEGMYLTSLYNFTQPLIRYRLSDELMPKLTPPQSTCAFSRVQRVQGRCEDMLWFGCNEKREFLHPLAVEGFNVEGLRDYQFRKVSDDAFEMIAEASNHVQRPAIRDELLRQMHPILRANNLEHLSFDVQFVDSILPDPRTGKKRLIVSN